VPPEYAPTGPADRLLVRLRSRRRLALAPLLGDSIDVFVRREDAERFIEEIRGDDLELAKPLRIEERELEAGGRIRRASLLA
jgi:hypothetical protein